jgi:uncharacterized protein (TIGR02145 family)
MKYYLFTITLFFSLISFSQSKKEQIEILNNKVDSLNQVLSSERGVNSSKINELNKTILDLEKKISDLNKRITKLTTDLELRIIESTSKSQKVSSLQELLKTKTDSLIILKNEVENLKSSPKPKELSGNTNQIAQTGNYKSVKIGSQVWMAENLNVSRFKNGDPIPEAKSFEEWNKASAEGKPAWCFYENDPKNGLKYGRLYNWYAVNDPRGLAPEGWHVPTILEWEQLNNFLGDNAGIKIKSKSGWDTWDKDVYCKNCEAASKEYKKICPVCKGTGVSNKQSCPGNGTNSSGFNAIPGGMINLVRFVGEGERAHWWSNTRRDNGDKSAYYSFTSSNFTHLSTGMMNIIDMYFGFPVRCIKD